MPNNYNGLIFENINDIEVLETILDEYELTKKNGVAILIGMYDEIGNLNVTRAHYLPTNSYNREKDGHIHIYAETLQEYCRDVNEGKENFIMTVISGENFRQLSFLNEIYYGTEEMGGKRFKELSDKVTVIGGFINMDQKMLVETRDDNTRRRFILPVLVRENDQLIALEDYYEDYSEAYFESETNETYIIEDRKVRERK